MIDFSLGKLKPNSNSNERIRRSVFNGLYVLIAMVQSLVTQILLIPLVIHWKVDENTHEDSPRMIMKMVLTILGILVLFKSLQFFKDVVFRQPIRC
jgi:hypothetical protein